MTGSLRTGSLRVRLLVSVMSVVLVLLVGIVVATTVLLQRQLEDSAADSLAGRAATAQQLLDNGAEPNEIVSATQGENVAAQIVTTDGRIVGDLTLRATTPPPALRPPPAEPGGGPPPGPAPADRAAATRVSTTTLSDGSVLTVAVDASSIDAVRSQLLTVLVPLVLVATAVAALLMAVVVQASLRPLRTMTALARSITRGHRGDRLNPTRSDTELGETATAFDEMLDELEGAEARERATADRTRQFVDDAAHDLRTPVAGISAAAETLLRRGVDTEGEVRERLLASMIRESRRAATLIDDLLVSARTDDDVELDRRDHDLLALARTDAERIRLLHPDVHITVAGSSVIASVDAARFARILANLTDNAVRHGPTNGTVTVTVGSSGDTGVVAVRDDGPGIAVGDRGRIFDRMVRLDDARSTDGSGLGLTIARTYARAHGGDVVYDGAAFVVTVPPGHGPVDAAASDARA